MVPGVLSDLCTRKSSRYDKGLSANQQRCLRCCDVVLLLRFLQLCQEETSGSVAINRVI